MLWLLFDQGSIQREINPLQNIWRIQYQPPFLEPKIIILHRYKMTEWTASGKIVVPTAFTPKSHTVIVSDQQEQCKGGRQTKIYIAPKHRTEPLTLNQRQPDQRKFSPSFDSFDLRKLFDKKELTPEELARFESFHEIDQDQFMTPPEKEGGNHQKKEWSSFRLIDNRFHSTSASNKMYRPPQAKKSRPKEKGLRKLSQRAYEIVLKMHSASYKEVANRLVDELNSQQELDQEGKDEQNIKRRVYDALNVLIALGVLRKEGRRIVGDRDKQLHFSQSMTDKIREELTQKQEQIHQKQKQIKNLQEKYRLYKELEEKHIGEHSETQTSQSVEKIFFPFLVLSNEKEAEMKGEKGEDGVCGPITMKWEKGNGDWGQFDIDLLVEYNRALNKIEEE